MRVYSVVLRVVTVALILWTLFEPKFNWPKYDTKIVAAVDLSDSMEGKTSQEIFTRAKFQSLEYLPFSGTTGVKLENAGSYSQLKSAWATLNYGESDLAGLFESNALESGSSVALLSDGWITKRDEEDVLRAVKEKNLKIFPILPENKLGGREEVLISQLYAPLFAQQKKSVEIRASVKNLRESPEKGTLTIRHDKKTIFEGKVTIPANAEELFIANSDPQAEGVKEIVATFVPDNKSLPQTERTIMLATARGEKLLLLNGSEEDEELLAKLLRDQGYELESVNGAIGDRDLSRYVAVIFNNIAAKEAGSLEKARNFVKTGGGFLMIGGTKSFGLGGYIGTAIQEILPVELIDPRAELKRVNVAVQLVLDKSKSMADGQRLIFAQEAAREVVKNLKDDDYVGVIGFDSLPFVVAKLAQLSESREQTLNRIGRLFPAGRTNLLPALDEARRTLERVQAGRKHVIVLTDGELPDGGPFYTELASQMRGVGITLSTVLLGGSNPDSLLRDMADRGGGSFYQTMDVSSLPRIFLNDIKVSTGEKTLKETSQLIVRNGTAEQTSTKLKNFPYLRGVVQTKPRDAAALELVAVDNDKAYPLLASWKYGSGKSIAFTSDSTGRWTSEWARSDKFSQFWSDLIDAIKPKQEAINDQIKYETKVEVKNGNLILEVTVYSEVKNLEGKIKLLSGEEKQLDFNIAAPGRFAIEIPNIKAGKYELNLTADGKKLMPSGFYLSGELFGEQKGKGFNTKFLEKLAVVSGGKINPETTEINKAREATSREIDMRPFLFALAMLFLILEIWLREVRS